jgi:hypothetical protein
MLRLSFVLMMNISISIKLKDILETHIMLRLSFVLIMNISISIKLKDILETA